MAVRGSGIPTFVSGEYNSESPIVDDGQQVPLQTDDNGNLLVYSVNGGGGGGNVTIISPLDGGDVAVKVENFPATQPVSGTITADQGTSPWVTEDASDGNPGSASPLFALQVAGSDGTDLRTLLTSNTGQVHVIVDSGGGGGTQYTDGTAESVGGFTGTVAMGYNGTDVVGLRLDASNNVKTAIESPVDGSGYVEVNVKTPTTFPVSGTVTAEIEGHAGGVLDAVVGAAVPANAIQVAGSDGTDLRALLTDTSGRQEVVGAAASGAAVQGQSRFDRQFDGTDARTLLTDNTGQLKVLVEGGTGIPVTGTVTAQIEGHAGGVLDAVVGAAIPANAILVGGSESGNIEPLLLDGSGFLKVNVAAGSSGNAAASPTGSAVPADADYLGASDGTNLIGLLVESTGNPNLRVGLFNGTHEAAVDAQGGVKVAGEAASGAAVTGNPVLVAGQDGTDARTLLTDNTGQLKVLVENGSAIAVSGTVTAEIEGHAGGVLDAVVGAAIPANAVLIGGSEAGNIEPLLLDASGFLKVNVAAGSAGNAAASATGSAVPADADYLGASDGTDLQGLLVESATHPNLRVALYNGAVEAAVDAQGGVKVAGEAASGSAVTGNPVLVAGQDGTDARTLLTDNTGQLKVLVEGGTGIPVTNAGTFAVQEATLDATIVAQGTSASSKILIAGGKSNDATAQYRELPLGGSGRSVIVEGYAGGTAVPISGTVTTQVTQGTRQAVLFTSSTPADTSNTIALVAYANVAVTLHYTSTPPGGTVTGGQMFFEVSDDNSNWYGITMAPTDDTQTGAAVTNFPVDNYTLSSAAGNITWQMFVGGYAYFRVRMHIQVVGSGTAIVAVIPSTAACHPAPQVTQGITPWVTAGVAASGAAVTGNPGQ